MTKEASNSETSKQTILCVSNDGVGASYFTYRDIALNGTSARMLSDQQDAVNFRLRTSEQDYSADWHVAGDPTLLIVLQGCLELSLRDGSCVDISPGQLFIAEDYLSADTEFTDQHGHKARVVGDVKLNALHLKLSKR